jgi:hypothetical protein
MNPILLPILNLPIEHTFNYTINEGVVTASFDVTTQITFKSQANQLLLPSLQIAYAKADEALRQAFFGSYLNNYLTNGDSETLNRAEAVAVYKHLTGL